MFVKRIRSNIKRAIDTELERKTIVVGPNASGKSGLVSSLELVLTGRSGDVGGLPGEIANLSHNGRIDIHAVLSDGKELSFSLEGDVSKAHRPRWTGRAGAVISDEIFDLLRAEPKRARQIMLSSLGKTLTDDFDVSEYVPEFLLGQWQKLWKESQESTENSVDALIYARNLARKNAREAKQIHDTVLGLATPECPSEAEVERLRAQVKKLQISPDQKKLRILDAQQFLQSVAEEHGVCPVCGVADTKEGFSRRKNMTKILIGSELRQDTAELQQAEDALVRAVQQQALVAEWSRRRSDQTKLDRDSVFFSSIAKTIDRYIAEALPEVIEKFQYACSRVLGVPMVVELFDDDRAVCRFGAKYANKTVYWKAMSGAERTRFTTAIASVWAQNCNESTRLLVVDDVWLDGRSLANLQISLDRALDLEKGLTQAIICVVETPREWKNKEGWKIVNL